MDALLKSGTTVVVVIEVVPRFGDDRARNGRFVPPEAGAGRAELEARAGGRAGDRRDCREGHEKEEERLERRAFWSLEVAKALDDGVDPSRRR